jgi:hypothetical protein
MQCIKSTTVATEFVTGEFETDVSDEAADQLAAAIEDLVRDLRSRIAFDIQLSEPGPQL